MFEYKMLIGKFIKFFFCFIYIYLGFLFKLKRMANDYLLFFSSTC